MDAIECGIVKLPRVPVVDNVPGAEMPMYRNLWEHIGKRMPKKGRGSGATPDPMSLPSELQTALEALYGHYDKTFRLWKESGIDVPPCFIVVCNNTATSKLVYDYIAGFHRESENGAGTFHNGRLPLFRNFDAAGTPLSRPRTLLIDSQQLESGDALDRRFRAAAAARDRTIPPGDRRTHPRPPASREPDGSGPAARGDEHRRQGRPARRRHPLRCLRSHADRRLGRQQRDSRSRSAGLRDATALRAGDRPLPAPAVLRAQRWRPLRCRVCGRLRRALRFHRQARRGAAAAARRNGAGKGALAGARRRRDPIPAGGRLPR